MGLENLHLTQVLEGMLLVGDHTLRNHDLTHEWLRALSGKIYVKQLGLRRRLSACTVHEKHLGALTTDAQLRRPIKSESLGVRYRHATFFLKLPR